MIGVLASLVALLFVVGSPARADVRIDVRESSWSAGQTPVALETIVRTWVQGPRRRLESQLVGAVSDSVLRATSFAQIDRLDRDSSYFVRPAERAYIPVAYAPGRAQNAARAEAMRAARAAGTAPRDTLGPVRVVELGRLRRIAGFECRGVLLELTFAYRDSAMDPGTDLVGILADTVWIAPPESPVGELGRFERDLARVTGGDSLLEAGNAVQISAQRGLGLVALIQRELRRQPGTVLASHFSNLLRGLPRGLTGVERLPDGTAIVQRTIREAVAVDTTPAPEDLFEPPAGFRRVERGTRSGAAPGAGSGKPGTRP